MRGISGGGCVCKVRTTINRARNSMGGYSKDGRKHGF